MSTQAARYAQKRIKAGRELIEQLKVAVCLDAAKSDLFDNPLLKSESKVLRIFQVNVYELFFWNDALPAIEIDSNVSFYGWRKSDVRSALAELKRLLGSKSFNTTDDRCHTADEKANADAIYQGLDYISSLLRQELQRMRGGA